MFATSSFPRQKLSYGKKGDKWRKEVLDWADDSTMFTDSAVRNSFSHKRINYRLLEGKVEMRDMVKILNPENQKGVFLPEQIQHYPILNSKINVLRGEEARRPLEYKLIVTNPNMVSEIEKDKAQMVFQSLTDLMKQSSRTEDEFNEKLQSIEDYYTYKYQDFREVRGNALLTHYIKELDLSLKFNSGFTDAMAVGEEMYQVDIVGGEPSVERLNPLRVNIFRSGSSSRVEDADIIVLKDYWSPGKIADYFYEDLTEADLKKLDEMKAFGGDIDSLGNIDERKGFVTSEDGTFSVSPEGTVINNMMDMTGITMADPSIDTFGNIKVMRVYWKSSRKIKKVKSYDPETGEAIFTMYTEDYKINTDMGEEETVYWINEAWEGTKIGDDIYLRMGPRKVQYNRMSNPSLCHFGIIGSVYNLNDSAPFSLVDMMKPYAYLYDTVADALTKALAANWGKMLKVDLAQIPDKWSMDKWLYYAKKNHMMVVDSFNEGNKGAATGRLAGGFAANSGSNGIDVETGDYIIRLMNILSFIKSEMSEGVGISPQREGQISATETVGGVERSNLQSSYITEWLFTVHNDIKKRVLECLLETAKMAMHGTNMKFQYITDEKAVQIMNIPGDEFAECDYGLVVDDSSGTQALRQDLKTLAQAGIQNQMIDFSTVMKIYTSTSLSETQRMIERAEEKKAQQAQEAQKQQNEQVQAQIQAATQQKQAELDQQMKMNQDNNQTKIEVAKIQAQSYIISRDNNAANNTQSRQFYDRLALDREKLDQQVKAQRDTVSLKQSALDQKERSDARKTTQK